MSKNEINVLRANIVGGMDAYVRDVIGDEEITEYWLSYGMPDGETEEDLMYDMEDEDTFNDWVTAFNNCLRMAKRG